MSEPSNEARRVEHLLRRIVDDRLTPSETEELEQLLRGDAALRKLYQDYIDTHIALECEGALLADCDAWAEASSGESGSNSGGPIRKAQHAAHRVSTVDRFRRTVLPYLPALAVALLVSVSGWLAWRSQALTRWTDASPEAWVATLTHADDCLWRSPQPPTGYGEHLVSGRVLKLAEGVANVTFDSGARVALHGPAEFVATGPSQCELTRGQISVVVPPRAIGFTVATPVAEFVDLGTEFGIEVDESGASEIRVIKGEVISRWRRNAPLDSVEDELRLVALQGARYDPGESEAERFQADDLGFVFPSDLRAPQSEPPVAPQLRGLTMWLAADLSARADSEGNVDAWRDVLCSKNTTPDDALQPLAGARPKLALGALNGQDAVRFDGESAYLVTTPMRTRASQTVFVVMSAPTRQPQHHVGSLLNYNGLPHRDMRDDSGPGVLQIGTSEQLWGGRGISAFVFVGAKGHSGRLQSPAVTDGGPAVIAYAYNHAKNRSGLYVNGERVAASTAPSSAAFTSRRILGRHGGRPSYFRGDVGELLIYNRGLSDDELNRVSSYLATKYRVGKPPLL